MKPSPFRLYEGNIKIDGVDGLWTYAGINIYNKFYYFSQDLGNGNKNTYRLYNINLARRYNKYMDTPLWKAVNQ